MADKNKCRFILTVFIDPLNCNWQCLFTLSYYGHSYPKCFFFFSKIDNMCGKLYLIIIKLFMLKQITITTLRVWIEIFTQFNTESKFKIVMPYE